MVISFINGKRVLLRTLEAKDLDGNYVKWFNDGEVCRYNSHHVFPYYRQDALQYIKNVNKAKKDLVLAIVAKRSGTHIGNISLQKIDYLSRSAELAIIIGEKKFWGKGYGKEAAGLLIEHGFSQMNLHRIYCGTTADNIGMQRLALSVGMKKEGRRREAAFKAGRYLGIVEYGLLKKEWKGV